MNAAWHGKQHVHCTIVRCTAITNKSPAAPHFLAIPKNETTMSRETRGKRAMTSQSTRPSQQWQRMARALMVTKNTCSCCHVCWQGTRNTRGAYMIQLEHNKDQALLACVGMSSNAECPMQHDGLPQVSPAQETARFCTHRFPSCT